MKVTEKLARFVVDTNLDMMPPEVVTIVKDALIDTVGVTLACSVTPIGNIIIAFVEKLGCRPVAGIIGGKFRTSPCNAALANGCMAHGLDYDDAGASTQGHPSAVLMPVALALSEELEASGREIIEAYVLGVEVWAKIARTMRDLHFKGWHPTAVFGTLGAAAVGAKLLKLDINQTAMALALAASEASGLGQNMGTMTKPFHAGNAAKNGIIAAKLAKEGFTAAIDIMEGDMGFLKAFYEKDRVDVSKMAENLGAPFTLVSQKIHVKKFPTCYATHRSLDGILQLINTYDIKSDEVESIDCQVSPRAKHILFHTNPTTGYEGKFSMQFAMAIALIDRKVGLAQVTDEKVNNPVIKDLMKKVSLQVHPDWVDGKDSEVRPDVVTVKLKNGKVFSLKIDLAKGHAKVPLSKEELLNKYRECAKMVLENNVLERSIDLIDNLERLKNLRDLMEIIIS